MRTWILIILLLAAGCVKSIPVDEPITIGGEEVKEIKK